MSGRINETVIVLPGTMTTIVAVCSGCGEVLTLPAWQVRLVCPHCGMSGVLDASRRNVLPTAWHCPSCAAQNPERVNFCLTCGAGLASRCRACEMPVYGAICLHCGAHQARLAHFASIQSGRATWEPLLRTRARTDPYPSPENSQPSSVTEPPQMDSQPVPVPTSKRKRRRRGWGGWWMIIPAYFMLQRWINPAIEQLLSLIQKFSLPEMQPSATVLPPVDVTGLLGGIQEWLIAPSQSDPLYRVLFGVTLVGIASLPLLLYSLERIIRRVFQ